MLTNQNILALLDERLAEIARTVFLECDGNGKTSVRSSDDASAKLREQIAFIKAKEHVTVKEAGLLLSRSQSHIRKLVALARKGKTRRPVPYIDLEGVIIFPRKILLDWASAKSQIQVVKYEAA
jgi:hypothetical protein